jgi:hypothetical protein
MTKKKRLTLDMTAISSDNREVQANPPQTQTGERTMARPRKDPNAPAPLTRDEIVTKVKESGKLSKDGVKMLEETAEQLTALDAEYKRLQATFRALSIFAE